MTTGQESITAGQARAEPVDYAAWLRDRAELARRLGSGAVGVELEYAADAPCALLRRWEL